MVKTACQTYAHRPRPSEYELQKMASQLSLKVLDVKHWLHRVIQIFVDASEQVTEYDRYVMVYCKYPWVGTLGPEKGIIQLSTSI